MKNIRVSWVIIIILLGILGVYLFTATRTTLWDRDEPRFARATVEMVTSGKYLVPTFNGELWADKPILTYWLQSLPVRILGPTEFAFRFFSAVGTAITCFFVFFIGKRLLDSTAALWAMCILSTTVMMFVIGTLATSDAVTLPFIIGAMMIFVYGSKSGMRIYQVILLGIALGLGMLAKGPIGLLPVPAIVVILWLNRRNLSIGRYLWQVTVSLVMGMIIFMIWAVPANRATGGEFLRVFVGHNVLERALKPLEHHGGNTLLYLPYYLPVVVAGFFPWTLHLPGAFSALWGGRVGGPTGRTLLIGWIVPIFIIMTLAATKLPHYILFIWPGLSLAVAGTIIAAQQNRLADVDRIWMRRGVWFFAPPAICVASALMIAPWFLQIPGLRPAGLASGIVLAVVTVSACFLQYTNKFTASAKAVLAGMIIFEILLVYTLLPALEQVKISPFISQDIKMETTPDVTVATYEFDEPSLNFYIGRKIEQLSNRETVINWTSQQKAGVLIIPADVLAEIQRSSGHLLLYKIASKDGFNYPKGEEVKILAMFRGKGNPK
jgi:4-amino-4-deoxy-L-arabinose transferase-like glycosyltransferase